MVEVAVQFALSIQAGEDKAKQAANTDEDFHRKNGFLFGCSNLGLIFPSDSYSFRADFIVSFGVVKSVFVKVSGLRADFLVNVYRLSRFRAY